MLKLFISFVLGPFGLKILDFYIRNSALINSLVFIYGIFLTLAHVNYKRITQDWSDRIKAGTIKKPEQKEKYDWEGAIAEHSRFPFVAGGTSLAPKRTSKENLLFYLERDKSWQKRLLKSVE
ncbi:MAG: hypothetical protein PWQ55_2670 [Chloroflexota bacterium]|nr:hypothetical protein [Chloroflexota bacterium]